MPLNLIFFFFLTAALYAAAGFAGGSTYTALLVLHGTDYRVLPSVSLVCNILVAAGGVWRFRQSGHIDARRIAPFVMGSAPGALIGGRLPVAETVFVGLLGLTLLVAGVRLLFQNDNAASAAREDRPHTARSIAAGFAIGLLSGLVGIGGGIFLAPYLYATRWGSERQIAGASSVFILVNSIAGLAGQLAKLSDLALLQLAEPYWPLPLVVIVGGQIGSFAGSRRLDARPMRILTALLILYAAARLFVRWRPLVQGS